ncbi:MAG: hypothetical protein V7K32_16375 [Nostoc sp.]
MAMINAGSKLQTEKIKNFKIEQAVTDSGQRFVKLSNSLSVQKTRFSTMTP